MRYCGKNRLWIVLCLGMVIGLGLVWLQPALADGEPYDPVFSIPGGVYNEPQTVTISCWKGWEINYTMDGTNPLSSESVLSGGQSVTLTISEHCDLKAVAVKGTFQSNVISQSYYLVPPGEVVGGVIVYSLAGGVYESDDGEMELTLSCEEGWKITYTTDGTCPVSNFDPPEPGRIAVKTYHNDPIGHGNSNPVTLTVSGITHVRAAIANDKNDFT